MFPRFIALIFCGLTLTPAFAQINGACPQNIGFEAGNLSNWRCYAGTIAESFRGIPTLSAPLLSLTESSPVPDQHELIMKGDARDEYGDFPLNSPNGSEYVVKLGNNKGGHGAERLSYTLNIPANLDSYSIIFNYAVVLQNPGHAPFEQPKFTVQIIDETTSSTTSCGSFEFVASGSLPGFESSKTNPGVLFKPWSPVLLNLNDYLGHRIRLEFTTNDCTFNQHFGYVYLDFTENCSYPVTGNVICPGPGPVILKTLTGFNEYEWFNPATREVLGTLDSLILPGTTPVGTQLGVKLVPYPGLGCTQTLYVTIEGPEVKINPPPPDCFSVDITRPAILAGNYPGQKYSYWADAAATIPLANPNKITKSGSYFIKGQNLPGCFAVGEVKVLIVAPPTISVTHPEPVDYPKTIDITKSFVAAPDLKYTYWKDSGAKVPLTNPKNVTRDATFYIKVTNIAGCSTVAPVVANIIYEGIVIPNAFTPNGDGVNDQLTVLIDNTIKIRSFKIFNKWGDVVFATTDIYNYWDGNRNGTSLPLGVYYWFVDGVDDKAIKIRKSGSVTVLR